MTIAPAKCIRLLAVALFATSGISALLLPPPSGCALRITNTGTEGSPDYGTSTCIGECVWPDANPCAIRVYAGTYVQFSCYCNDVFLDPTLTTQACVGTLSNEGGSWKIDCATGACDNPCVESKLPLAGKSAMACNCPDPS